VLVNDPEHDDPKELLRGLNMPLAEIVNRLSFLDTTKIVVEEFVGSSLPTEYKVHVVDGDVAAIDIIINRGSDCGCYAAVDVEDWNRLDKYICFEPSGMEESNGTFTCTAIDFTAGEDNAGPFTKNLNLCSDDAISKPDLEVINEIIVTAVSLSKAIGVFMRIDMFVNDKIVYVQEYSPNHMGGMRRCAAKVDSDGCIDSCFLGKMWKASGPTHGGVKTKMPDGFQNFRDMAPSQQCNLIESVKRL